MPKLNFTDSVIKSLKPKGDGSRADYFDNLTIGLVLRVSAHGTKSWIARFRHEGKQQMVTLGRYPVLSLKKARDAMAAIRAELASDVNPADVKREKKAERQEALTSRTISAIGKAYLYAASKGRHKSNANKPLSLNSLKTHSYASAYVDSIMGDTLVTDLKRSDIDDVLYDLEEAHNTGRAVIARDYLSGLFSFAIHRDLIEYNPVLKAYKPSYASRDRVIDNFELKVLINSIRHANVWCSAQMRIAIELCAVTATRAGETAGLMLAELDLDAKLWTIPKNRTKNGKQHTVPLSDHALDLIQQALSLHKYIDNSDHGGDLEQDLALFHSPSAADKPITAHAMSKAFRRITERCDVKGIRLHDLRRTAATTMAQLGISNSLISKVLNHANTEGAQVTGVYNRYDYVDEKRRALDAWANRFADIVDAENEASNVVLIKQV